MKPITIEVLSLVPGLFDLWPHCEYVTDQVGLKKKKDERDLNEYPEDLKEEYLFLSDWIRELASRYREQILIRVIDVQSLQGVYKSLRHGIHRYPTLIINKKEKYTGKDKARFDALLQQHLRNV